MIIIIFVILIIISQIEQAQLQCFILKLEKTKLFPYQPDSERPWKILRKGTKNYAAKASNVFSQVTTTMKIALQLRIIA